MEFTYDQYVEDVLSGRQITCRYVKQACERHVKDKKHGKARGIGFDDTAAKMAIAFFAATLRHSKGEWAGQPLMLEPWQQFHIGSLFGWRREDGTRRFRTSYLEIARKNGKMLDLETPVPTPSGWTTMGEIQVGDVIFDEQGNQTTVTALSDIDPEPESYLVAFSNGEKIKACADHQWLTTARVNNVGGEGKRQLKRWKPPSKTVNAQGYLYANLWRRRVYVGPDGELATYGRYEQLAREDLERYPVGRGGRTRVRTTKEIYETQTYGERGDRNHGVGVAGALQLPDRELPVDPYFLGLWLGDGSSTAPDITTNDPEVVEFLRDYALRLGLQVTKKGITYAITRGYTGGTVEDQHQSLHYKLKILGVFGNKHIPTLYLRASYDQRLALLQGLMDSDGYVSKRGQCEYTSIDRRLADDALELVTTMGIKASLLEHDAMLNGRYISPKYRVVFHAFRDVNPVFRLPRKLERMKVKGDAEIAPRSKTIQIVSVGPCAPVPMRCLTVDSPSHLFLVGRTMIPTHNSTMAAGVGLYGLVMDGEQGAEIFSAATKRDQARITFDEAQRMVLQSPPLKHLVKVQRHNIHSVATNSKFIPLGADADSLDGLNPHFCLIDEVHQHKTRALWDVLLTAIGARRQPLLYSITTAGFDRQSLCYNLHTYSEQILSGVIEDDTFFPLIYTLDDGDDFEDENNWVKANPNLGISKKVEAIRVELRQALIMPSQMNKFLNLQMNLWTQSETRWVNREKWDACDKGPIDEDDLVGRRCYAGLDLSSNKDVTACVYVFPPPTSDEDYIVVPRFWIPEDNMHDRIKLDRVPYDAWVRSGLVTATPGDVIDYDWIVYQLGEDIKKFDLHELSFDRWGSSRVTTQLQNELGFRVDEKASGGPLLIQFGQGYASMSGPMRELEKLILAGRLSHAGNRVLTWMADNLVTRMDPSGNLKPDKEKSIEKIDGMVALIMGLARAIAHGEPGKSVYHDRGIRVL